MFFYNCGCHVVDKPDVWNILSLDNVNRIRQNIFITKAFLGHHVCEKLRGITLDNKPNWALKSKLSSVYFIVRHLKNLIT